jgi:hypothetical protein
MGETISSAPVPGRGTSRQSTPGPMFSYASPIPIRVVTYLRFIGWEYRKALA